MKRFINPFSTFDFVFSQNLPEAELRDAHEQLLQSVSARTVSHCFGRAAIDFRSFSPPLNRPLVVPELNLQGRIHPSNTPFELPQNDVRCSEFFKK